MNVNSPIIKKVFRLKLKRNKNKQKKENKFVPAETVICNINILRASQILLELQPFTQIIENQNSFFTEVD